MNRGLLRMTPGGVDVMAGPQLVAGVIRDARRRQRRRRLTAALMTGAGVALATAVLSSGGAPSGRPGGIGSTSPPIPGGRTAASAGVSVRLPPGWVAQSMVLPQGGGRRLAWLQATNFATGRPPRGEDPLKAMRAGQVAITVTDWTPGMAHVRSQSPPRLSVSRALPLPAAQTRRGHVVLELAPTIHGRALVIDVDFGSRATQARMRPVVDRVLQTLGIRSVPSAQMPSSTR